MIDVIKTLLGPSSQGTVTGESPGAAFLRRREERRVEREIKSQSVLGLVLGAAVLLVSFYKLYLGQTDWPGLFMLLEGFSFLLLAATLIIPQLLAPIEGFCALLEQEWEKSCSPQSWQSATWES